MTPQPPSSPASMPGWLRWLIDHRRNIAGAIGALIVVVSPFVPAARPWLEIAKKGIDAYQQIDQGAPISGSSSSSSSSSSSTPAGCPEPPIRSLPHFCRCVGDGDWRDYFDLDAGCPQD